MIQFHSKNFMLKKTINRMVARDYMSDGRPLIYVLDSQNNMVGFHWEYSEDLEDAVCENGIFLVLAVMEYSYYNSSKGFRFGEECPEECVRDFIVTTRNHRNFFYIPEWQCPDYVSPELFGIRIRKIGDEFELTYGLYYKEYYDIIFDRGYEDIEIEYAEEIEIALEVDKKPARFIPFNENDDELDKYSVNNLFNPKLIKFMYDGLSFGHHM